MLRALRQLISLPAVVALTVAHVIALWSAAFYGTNWTKPSWTTNSFKCQRWSRRTRRARSSRAAFTLILPKGRGDLQSLHCTLKNAVRMHKSQSWILIAAGDESRRLSMQANARYATCRLWMCREKPTALTILKKEKGCILVLENTLQQYR